MPRHLTAPSRAALILLPASLALAACSASVAAEDTATASGTPTATATTIDNCGTPVTLGSTPERIVTVKSTTTELLVELGLADRIVGAAFLDGAVESPYTEPGVEIPVISDFLPGREAALALEPDAVFGGWESNFADDGVGDRADLASQGILTYVAPSACKEDGYQPDPLTFDLLFAQIEEAGTVFGTPDAAATLVARLTADLAEVEPSTAGLTALWYSSGSDTPYVGAGIGAPQMIMDAAGLTNIFAEVDDTWTSATWEAVVAADPDVLVLVDASWNTAQSKIAMLEASPATSSLTAVQTGSYVIVPFAAGEAGVRNVAAVVSIVDQLAELGAA